MKGGSAQNPLMALTGCILFAYTYEGIVRIMGYGETLLDGTRILDSIDIVVVLACAYCMT